MTVVIETVTAAYETGIASVVEALAPTIDALEQQTYPRDLIEILLVLDENLFESWAPALRARFPAATLITSQRSYFAAKNRGAELARGEVVLLLDGDCVPSSDWIERLVGRLEPGVPVVAGCSRYQGQSLLSRTFSVSSFANVVGDASGASSGFNLHNVAFRRDVLVTHPFDQRVRRNGACYLLFHQLRAEGIGVAYEPRAKVFHADDHEGWHFVRKHFDRGYDGVSVYRIDDRRVLRGTTIFKRFGALGLVALSGRRLIVDWARLARDRQRIGIPLVSWPYFAGVMLLTRSIELIGGFAAIAASHRRA